MLFRSILCSFLLGCITWPCAADDTAWTQLFDGKTLSGWSTAATGDVSVVEGEIRIMSKTNLWLVHEAIHDDFELIVDAKMPANTYNSGIGFRCQGGKKVKGYQCEIDRKLSGMIYAIGSGWVWPKTAQDRKDFAVKSDFENAKWNTYRIRCQGDRIQIWINDKPIADVRDGRFKSGSVALQHHGKGDTHRFRNVRIRKLDGLAQSTKAK